MGDIRVFVAKGKGQHDLFLAHRKFHTQRQDIICIEEIFLAERYESGLLGALGERVYRKVPRVRIPPSPPFFEQLGDSPIGIIPSYTKYEKNSTSICFNTCFVVYVCLQRDVLFGSFYRQGR